MLSAASGPIGPRLASIDRLRGLVMLLMLVDHVREFFFLHQQVADPMSIASTSPQLFFTRFASHFCAPVFVLLTGLGAWLHGTRAGNGPAGTMRFLLTRGLVLMALELSVINFAWSFSLQPPMIYLQVIWAIGLSMVTVAALIRLPRPLQIFIALAIMFGHNTLDAVHFTSAEPGFIPWAILHDRSVIELGAGFSVRTSYPLLPWIGIMLLGYQLGPLYGAGMDDRRRQRLLCRLGAGCMTLFVLLRLANAYGDHAWQVGNTVLESLMAFLNVTKYPPSLHFILLTLGVGLPLLALMERLDPGQILANLGRVPMFFYVSHLYLLHLLQLLLTVCFGPNQGPRFGFSEVWQLWALAGLVAFLLSRPCRWFGRIKQSRKARWLSYF